MTLDEALQTALAHHQAGRLPEAESLYRQILGVEPDEANSLSNLGVIALQTGHLDAAIELISKALRINPNDGMANANLGAAYLKSGRAAEAVRVCRRAVALRPDQAVAHLNLANGLLLQRQSEPAIGSFKRALKLQPDFFDAHNDLCVALQVHGDRAEAMVHGRRAVDLNPQSASAWCNLANALFDGGQMDEALPTFRRALSLAPDNARFHSNLIMLLHYYPDTTAPILEAEHRLWNQRHAVPLRDSLRPHDNDPDPGRRLKVGYVSPDFRAHAVSFFLLPLLEAHDPSNVEVHCFASSDAPDWITKRYRRRVDVWHDVFGLSDAVVAQRIREAKIDVLVDLSMHSTANRLLTFALEPAPVQVAWLAHPGTTGVDGIAYRITDTLIEPPAHDANWSSEETVYLPDGWCCYSPLEKTSPPVALLPALSRNGGQLTFGAFNNFVKFNAPTLCCWAKILAALPDSRLHLRCPEDSARRWVHSVFAQNGIETQRVMFIDRGRTRQDYLRQYDRVDVALDTWPYNGTTTTCDALWMGVPVLSLYGNRASSRTSLSLLTNIGLAELAVPTEEELVQAAVNLATGLPRLAELRATMRERMLASPLMDAPRFARHMEAAYRRLWQRWCDRAGTPPADQTGEVRAAQPA